MLFVTLMAFALVPGDVPPPSSSSSNSDGSDSGDGGIGDLLFTFNPFAIAVWWLLCIMAFIGIKASVGTRNSVNGTSTTTSSAASAPPAGIAYPAYNYHVMTGTATGTHVNDSQTANEAQQYVPPVPTAGTNAV
jgi:hypothetical protein